MNTKHTPTRTICADCSGRGAIWPDGELRGRRCRSCNGCGKVAVVVAQHDETGRMWEGPLCKHPRRYAVVSRAALAKVQK